MRIHFKHLSVLLMVATACSSTPTPRPTAVPIVPTATPMPPTNTPATTPTTLPTNTPQPTHTPTPQPTPTPTPHPLSIAAGKTRTYPGSEFVIEQTLPAGGNYNRYVASYLSDGYKIFGLLTIPTGAKPASGWPIIMFNHGYIPPTVYRTTERYVAYQDIFARAGYITFKSDYRGHGSSEGSARGGYGNTDYTIDVLNGLGAVKKLKDSDPNRIGFWGHSMGGAITLRAMVTTGEIKAGVIWAGVVASYPDLISRWRRPGADATAVPASARAWRNSLVNEFGSPEQNPTFWAEISPNSFLGTIAPIQLHHGTADADVPLEFSQTLAKQLKDAGRTYEIFEYPGDDHNLSQNLFVALQRSVSWFDKHVKNS